MHILESYCEIKKYIFRVCIFAQFPLLINSRNSLYCFTTFFLYLLSNSFFPFANMLSCQRVEKNSCQSEFCTTTMVKIFLFKSRNNQCEYLHKKYLIFAFFIFVGGKVDRLNLCMLKHHHVNF